jgi:hypothetical protein
MSSSHEAESVATSEYESDLNSDALHEHELLRLDPHIDSSSDSDSDYDSESDSDDRVWLRTMCYPSCGLCRFEFDAGEEFVVCMCYPVR